MSNVARLDPLLARHGLRAPEELDGRTVENCLRVIPGSPPWFDAVFEVGSVTVLASTSDRGRTWKTVVSNR